MASLYPGPGHTGKRPIRTQSFEANGHRYIGVRMNRQEDKNTRKQCLFTCVLLCILKSFVYILVAESACIFQASIV